MDDLKVMIGEMRGEMRSRFDAQDLRLGKIEDQTTKTNGRVTALELESAGNRAAKDTRVQVRVEKQEETDRIKWWVGTLIAAGGLLVGASGAAVAFLT